MTSTTIPPTSSTTTTHFFSSSARESSQDLLAVSTPQVEAFNQPPVYAATPETTRPHGSALQETADPSFLNVPNRYSGYVATTLSY